MKRYARLESSISVINTIITEKKKKFLKVAPTNMRYFARSKFCTSLVHKKSFSLIWQVVFKGGRVPLLSFNELTEKAPSIIILRKFIIKSSSNSHWLIVFGKYFSLLKM